LTRTVLASGTQAATVGTEHTLRDETGSEGNVLDAIVDLGNMASGDTVEIRVYMKALSGGTIHRAYYQKFVGSQDDEGNLKSPIIYVPATTATSEWKLTLKQTAGTGRNYDWTIYKN
jgi:hypothetical protein